MRRGAVCAAWMCAVLGTAVSAIDVTTQCEQLWNAKLDRSETDRYNKLHGLMHGRLVPPSHMAIFDFFMPSWSCEDKQFIGEPERFKPRKERWNSDGMKVMCGVEAAAKGNSSEPCLALSFGSNLQTEWEEDLYARTGCEIHTFDPTTDPVKNAEALKSVKGTFHPLGLAGGAEADNDEKYQTLPYIMKTLFPGRRRIDFLKIDAEGAEHEALGAFLPAVRHGLYEIGTLNLEVHRFDEVNYTTNPQAWRALFRQDLRLFFGLETAGLTMFSREPNVLTGHAHRVMEFSWLDSLTAVRTFVSTHCPTVPEAVYMSWRKPERLRSSQDPQGKPASSLP